MKNIISIALVLFFNDFLGAVMAQVGLLLARLGTMLSSIPDFL